MQIKQNDGSTQHPNDNPLQSRTYILHPPHSRNHHNLGLQNNSEIPNETRSRTYFANTRLDNSSTLDYTTHK